MRLKYETGIVTFIQFAAISILSLISMINSIVVTCIHDGSSECVGNIIPSIGFFIVTAIFFFCIWMVGYFAQENRNKWLALALIGIELLVARVAYHNAKSHTDLLGLFTSIVDIVLALVVVFLAFRLFRSKGGRIVSKQRPRQRRRRQSTAD